MKCWSMMIQHNATILVVNPVRINTFLGAYLCFAALHERSALAHVYSTLKRCLCYISMVAVFTNGLYADITRNF